jgi:alkylation response protein AidB-like acyl-CoA dehydrogenase
MTNPVFLALFRNWILEMRHVAAARPGTGACTLATAMTMWLWTLEHMQTATDADGSKLYQSARQGVSFPLADALAWIIAARCQVLDLIELENNGAQDPSLADGFEGTISFLTDLCHVQTARASGEASRICTELVFGYKRHPAWDEIGYRECYRAHELEALESIIPGIGATACDIVNDDGTHPPKAGPCAKCHGAERFLALHSKLATCLTGVRLAKDRAAEALSKVMIPEALDYPA